MVKDLFRTVVECHAAPHPFGYDASAVVLGSCFADEVGARMQAAKFDVCVNPFGAVYHPAAAARQLLRLAGNRVYDADELACSGGLWCSFDHHGRFSHPDRASALAAMNAALAEGHAALMRSGWLVATLGTAWGYRWRATGCVAANCHRFPASSFERTCWDADQIFGVWADALAQLRTFNPHLRVVFTVSPVRHLRDGAHGNQLSKAALLLAADRLCREFAAVDYFPAYEFLLDDLRDYRFYGEDMVHPSPSAVEYVWRRFCDSYLTAASRLLMAEVEAIVRAAAHRPHHLTEDDARFARVMLDRIRALQLRHPRLDFSAETSLFERRISAASGSREGEC